MGCSFLKRLSALAVGVIVATGIVGCRKEEASLPNIRAQLQGVTVSGLSGGAYMAGQFQMAHASIVSGAGLVAGGPYGCADSVHADQMPGPAIMLLNVSKARNGCMLDALRLWDVPNPEGLAERARRFAQSGRIDPIAQVAADKVYLFTGTQDRVVVPSIVAAARDFYRAIGVPGNAIAFVDTIGAGHALVTETEGAPCAETEEPYVVQCGYDQAGEMLRHLLGPLQPRAGALAGRLETFDQRAFTDGLGEHGMDDVGLVYVPPSCRTTAGCRIHVAFHGCNQSLSAAGEVFARSGALLAWAETNRLVVLFPQVVSGALNPQGCWDWWGYTGREYLTRDGPQIKAVRRMLDRLGGQGQGARASEGGARGATGKRAAGNAVAQKAA